MKRYKFLNVVAGIAALAITSAVSQAAIDYKFNNILVDTEFFAGSGSNEAMVIVSYPYTLGAGDSFAFLYRWDGNATLADAFNGIQAASSGDFVWDGNNFVLQMDYFDPDTSTQYNSSTSGWMSFWGTTNADATDWSTNSVGNADYDLTDGEWQWVNTDVQAIGWPGPNPNVYATVAVPEPSAYTITLAALAFGLLHLRRFKTKRSHA